MITVKELRECIIEGWTLEQICKEFYIKDHNLMLILKYNAGEFKDIVFKKRSV